MRSIRFAGLLLALSAIASPATAQDAAPAKAQEAAPARKPFTFGMTANSMAIDPTAASRQLVGSRSWGMQFDGGVTFGKFLYAGVDFGPMMLSDHASFTQATTAGNKSSSAMLLYFSGMAGARTGALHMVPGLPAASLGLYGGASATKGERSIDNCLDCTSQNIAIDGGSFVQPTLLFGEGAARMRVSGRQYLGGTGMKSVVSLGLELGGM